MTAFDDVKKAIDFYAEYFEREVLGDLARNAVPALESLQRENKALKQDRYDLAYAITGGEDAPGLLDTVPTSHLVEIARDTHRSHSADIDRAEAAEAEVKRLRAVVERAQLIVSTSTYPNWHEAARQALASTGGEHNGN